MKEKNIISRQQFLIGSATVLVSALLGKLSGDAYADEKTQNKTLSTLEQGWEQLPLDILSGAHLISDFESELFGSTIENAESSLSQYFHVYPGLELMLSNTNGAGNETSWVGYDKEFQPIAVLYSNEKTQGNISKDNPRVTIVTVPSGVYYCRGSCCVREKIPCAWVRSIAQYMFHCGINKPDLTSYTEITELALYQNTRKDTDGNFDKKTNACPALGDVFFSPIGTDIILTFKNANMMPYIYSGENYMLTTRKNLFIPHYGFNYSWYYCSTTDICNWLGASLETFNGYAKPLTVEELQAADPHLYIRFPGHVMQVQNAAKIRIMGVAHNYQRLFTVVHVTDTHGDEDTTHAIYEYADQIGADFIALTGDYVPYGPYHGYSILHSLIKSAKTPTVFSVGNHDVIGISDQTVYDTIIMPIKEAVHTATDTPYYYRDFEYGKEIVRVISLYPFFDEEEFHARGYYTQKQLLWLCDVLSSSPDNSHIFILRHFSHSKPILYSEDKNMFYDYNDSDKDEENHWLSMGSDPVTEIVDAYNRREKISALFSGELKDHIEAISVKYDFSSRPRSEFVAYFTGHVHIDAVAYARGTQTKQTVLSSVCSTGVKGTAEYSAYSDLRSERDYGTGSQIAFNVFSFDFEKKNVYIARAGNGLCRGHEKTWMEISYA